MNNEVIYAGFWKRFIATILDWIWFYGAVYLSLWLIQGEDFMSPDAGYTATQFILEWIVPLVVVMAFWVGTSSSPGKMIFNIKIVDAETFEKVSPPRLLLRYIGYFVSFIPLFLGFFWVGWDKKKQGWHDKIAKTVLVVSK